MLRIVRPLLALMTAVSLAAFAYVEALRLFCPIELGNGEGLMMDEAIRIMRGLPLYAPPSLEFIPFVYMPLFPALIAPLAKLFGPDLWQGRLVDVLSIVGLLVLMFEIVRRATGSRLLGAAAGTLFLMGHGITRGGYDVLRPDTTMLFFALAGLALLRFSSGARGAVGAALLLALAFFTKQHGLLYSFAALVWVGLDDRRRLPVFALALAAFVGGGWLLLRLWLGPWFTFYTYDVPSHWSLFSRARVYAYVGGAVFGMLGALTLPSLLASALPGRPWRGRDGLWAWAALGAAGTGLLATLDIYASYHVLMPSLMSFCILGPIALDRLGSHMMKAGAHERTVSAVVAMVMLIQFVPLLSPVHTLRPRPGAAESRRELVARLRSYPGRVFVPFHGYLTWIAGKGQWMNVLALDDIIRSRGNRLLARDPGYFDRMFEPLRKGPDRPVIVSDTALCQAGDVSRPLWCSLEWSYRRTGSLGDLVERIRPVAGGRNAPTWIYEPAEPSEADSARLVTPAGSLRPPARDAAASRP